MARARSHRARHGRARVRQGEALAVGMGNSLDIDRGFHEARA
jgi:hypothetical protein